MTNREYDELALQQPDEESAGATIGLAQGGISPAGSVGFRRDVQGVANRLADDLIKGAMQDQQRSRVNAIDDAIRRLERAVAELATHEAEGARARGEVEAARKHLEGLVMR